MLSTRRARWRKVRIFRHEKKAYTRDSNKGPSTYSRIREARNSSAVPGDGSRINISARYHIKVFFAVVILAATAHLRVPCYGVKEKRGRSLLRPRHKHGRGALETRLRFRRLRRCFSRRPSHVLTMGGGIINIK